MNWPIENYAGIRADDIATWRSAATGVSLTGTVENMHFHRIALATLRLDNGGKLIGVPIVDLTLGTGAKYVTGAR